ncbi:zf-TFIIB domain-containing protein [Bdellovibrio sp. HCB290]|uniref:TFIIB-type zinc ribbon-containing protein n=1 Tax=Bdellovibrio sp. HCB290 TaxID=3394356 RepID=UPI0039B50122
MKCPSCKDKDLVMSERKGVEIDYCPECRGIWLDKGELDKILERSQQEDSYAKPAQDTYMNSQPNYGHKPYKKRKSFFEELFD